MAKRKPRRETESATTKPATDRAVTVRKTLTKCPACGSTKRTRYTKSLCVAGIVRKQWCRCLDCNQSRVDQSKIED